MVMTTACLYIAAYVGVSELVASIQKKGFKPFLGYSLNWGWFYKLDELRLRCLEPLHICTCVIGYAERKHIRTNMPVTERQLLQEGCRKYMLLFFLKMVAVHQNMGAWGEALPCSRVLQTSDSRLYHCQNGLAVIWISLLRHNAFKLWVWCEISLALIYNVKKTKLYLIYSLTDSNWF